MLVHCFAVCVACFACLSLVLGNPVFLAPERINCLYNNKTYPAGRKFRPEPCTLCRCPKTGGQPMCSIQDCMYEPNCIRHTKIANRCCQVCQEFGCQHSDGKIYPPGAVVLKNKCERCYCPAGGGKTVCDRVACPHVNCVDAVKHPDDCCHRCPNGPNCWLGDRILPAGKIVESGKCQICQCQNGNLPFWILKKGFSAVCTIGDCS